jgi:hypothetical protein
MGMRPYVIRQGDYLSQLAFRRGFNADEVWSTGENEALRRVRPSPEMLAPGDVLQIPETPAEAPALRIGAGNRYVARVPTVKITLELSDEGRALANEPYQVEGLGRPLAGQSNGQGHVEFEVPVTTREVHVALPGRHLTVPVLVGHLDPIETRNGVRQRLDQLGYFHGIGQSAAAESDAAALRRFQQDHQLPVTGEVDDATRQALSGAHRS